MTESVAQTRRWKARRPRRRRCKPYVRPARRKIPSTSRRRSDRSPSVRTEVTDTRLLVRSREAIDAEAGSAGIGGTGGTGFAGLLTTGWAFAPSLADLRFPENAFLSAAPNPLERRILRFRWVVGLSTGSGATDPLETGCWRLRSPEVGKRCSVLTTGDGSGRFGRALSAGDGATPSSSDWCVGEVCMVAWVMSTEVTGGVGPAKRA